MPFMWVMILKLQHSHRENVQWYISFNALYVGDDFETNNKKSLKCQPKKCLSMPFMWVMILKHIPDPPLFFVLIVFFQCPLCGWWFWNPTLNLDESSFGMALSMPFMWVMILKPSKLCLHWQVDPFFQCPLCGWWFWNLSLLIPVPDTVCPFQCPLCGWWFWNKRAKVLAVEKTDSFQCPLCGWWFWN